MYDRGTLSDILDDHSTDIDIRKLQQALRSQYPAERGFRSYDDLRGPTKWHRIDHLLEILETYTRDVCATILDTMAEIRPGDQQLRNKLNSICPASELQGETTIKLADTDQSSRILIVTVTKVEAQAVLEVFSRAAGKMWTRQVIGNKTYYNLSIHGGAPVYMVQSEMGIGTPGGALLTVRQAIQDLRPQAVIMCGIAFGLRLDNQQLGDILIARQLLYYEPQKVEIQRGDMPRGDRITSAERLLDRFRSGVYDWQGAPTHFGLIVSGEKLINDPTFRNRLLKAEPEAIGGEMEGAGLYAAARDAKVDWILVKAICDWADGTKDDTAQELAARNAAQFVLYVLRLGGWGNPVPHLKSLSETETEGENSERSVGQENYVDFALHIGPGGHARAHSNEGERDAAVSLEIPSNISLTLNLIEAGKTNDDLLKQLGKRLYEIIFPNSIDILLNQTEAVGRSKGHKLRIRLTVEPDELARLPWEFTYREEGGYFLSVNPDTVLSRYLNLPLPQGYVRAHEGPLHMLIIIAGPKGLTPIDPDKWEKCVTDALVEPIQGGLITTTAVSTATFENIRDALLKQKPDIVQFIGHGAYDNGKGYLALVNSDSGGSWVVDDEQFARIFSGFTDHLGLVCLMACEGAKSDSPQGFLGIAPQIVQKGVPAVVAMQYPISFAAGKIFLENFYKALAARKPVDWATQFARNAISIKQGTSNREFATPVLFMRAKDGNIF